MKQNVFIWLSGAEKISDIEAGYSIPLFSKYDKSDYLTSEGYVMAGTAEITYAFKDQKKVTIAKIKALELKLGKVRAENEGKINEIINEIKNLQSITFEA